MAPFSSDVRVEQRGEVWLTWRTCQDCGAQAALESDNDPGRWAKLAAMFLCESCGARASEAEERARREELIEQHVRGCGIPRPLLEVARWEDLIDQAGSPDDTLRRREAIQAAREWAADRKPAKGLLLWGEPGTGKTRLAATAAVERMAHSPIRWVSVGVLMAQLEGAWNDRERQDALKVLTSTGAVVLDDFDKVKPNAQMQSALFTALDKREQAGAAIIVTTNLDPRKQSHFNEAIVSRLLGMCRVLRYPGPDLRVGLR